MIQRHPAGCGVHDWQRAGADVQDFQQDSWGCVTEAKVPRLSIEPEQVHRACMRARMGARSGECAGTKPVQGP